MKIMAFAAIGTLVWMGFNPDTRELLMNLTILFCVIGWPTAFIYSKVKRFKNTKPQPDTNKAAILQKR